MPKRYTRVKDKETGHEYDVLAHKVDEAKHTPLNRKAWPDVTYPRPAKPNVKSARPSRAAAQAAPQKNSTDNAGNGA